MEGISDIRIIGIDEKRPPRIRKEPYIDLFFKLSHKAPKEWCKDFNELMAQHPTAPNIAVNEGLYIQSWVRSAAEIVDFLQLLKESITECSRQYIERIELASRLNCNSDGSQTEEAGEQGRLNKIIASLEFDKAN